MADFIVPNPLVSRAKPTFRAGFPAQAAPAWLAMQVGPGPSRVLVSWSAPGSDYRDARRAPASYRIESSADSSDGSDGTWRTEVTVDHNAVRARAHSFEFDGQSWVRLVVTGVPPQTPGVSLDAFDVHDASDGTDDSWFFIGDDVAARAFRRDGALRVPTDGALGDAPFAASVHAEYAGYSPAIIDGSIPGEDAAQALARLDEVLALNPDVRFFVIAFGADGARSGQLAPDELRRRLELMVDRVAAAGRVPVLPPVCDSRADGRAWAEAMDALYVPQ